MNQIAKSSLMITVFTVLGMGLGFLGNVVIASKFGAGKDMDVFLASTTLPLFITSILSGALNFTFVPVFAEYRIKHPSEIWRVASSFINLNVTVIAVLCIFGIIAAHPIMKATMPGFSEEKLNKSAELLQWLFPIIIFTVVNELMASVYYSNRRFVIPSLNKIISPFIIIAYVILFHNLLSTKSIILALLTAAFIQTSLLAVGFFKTRDFHYSFVFDYKHPGVLKLVKLMTPLVLGMLIYRSVPIIDRFFLSRLPEGSVSHIGYAFQLMNAIPPIIVSGISVSISPVMSEYAAEGNLPVLKEVMIKGIRMVLFLSVPLVVLLGTYGKSVICLFLERGEFTPADTAAVYYAFSLYLLALPAGAIGSIISQGFYVLQQNKIIAFIGVVMMGLYVALCLLFLKSLAYLAFPVAYAIYHNCAVIITTSVLKSKVGEVEWLPVVLLLLKSAAAALISAFFIYPAVILAGDRVFIVNILCALGFFVYFFIGKFALCLEEPRLIWRVISFR